jgi:hypothetical protein
MKLNKTTKLILLTILAFLPTSVQYNFKFGDLVSYRFKKLKEEDGPYLQIKVKLGIKFIGSNGDSFWHFTTLHDSHSSFTLQYTQESEQKLKNLVDQYLIYTITTENENKVYKPKQVFKFAPGTKVVEEILQVINPDIKNVVISFDLNNRVFISFTKIVHHLKLEFTQKKEAFLIVDFLKIHIYSYLTVAYNNSVSLKKVLVNYKLCTNYHITNDLTKEEASYELTLLTPDEKKLLQKTSNTNSKSGYAVFK